MRSLSMTVSFSITSVLYSSIRVWISMICSCKTTNSESPFSFKVSTCTTSISLSFLNSSMWRSSWVILARRELISTSSSDLAWLSLSISCTKPSHSFLLLLKSRFHFSMSCSNDELWNRRFSITFSFSTTSRLTFSTRVLSSVICSVINSVSDSPWLFASSNFLW